MVEKDLAATYRWYRQAAELGNVDAQIELGIMHSHGSSIEQSDVEALYWLLVAESQIDESDPARADSIAEHKAAVTQRASQDEIAAANTRFEAWDRQSAPGGEP